LQSADRGTREPSQFGRAKLFLLPRAQNVQALRGQRLRVIQQGRFQHLARQFSGSGEFRERATGGLIQLRENTVDRLLLFESIGNQCIGFDHGQWPGVYCDLHGSPFFGLKLRFVERSVKFANPRDADSPAVRPTDGEICTWPRRLRAWPLCPARSGGGPTSFFPGRGQFRTWRCHRGSKSAKAQWSSLSDPFFGSAFLFLHSLIRVSEI